MVILRDIRLRWCMLSLSDFHCFFFSFWGRGSEIGSFAGSLLAIYLSVIVSITIRNHHSFIPSPHWRFEKEKKDTNETAKEKKEKNHR